MSWLSWHEKSEQFASDAHVVARQGDNDRALALFAEAAEAENQALSTLDTSKARTFGITAVSAVSLWFKAHRFAEAERLALRCLATGELPAFAVEQLRALLQAVWTAEAMRRVNVSFSYQWAQRGSR